MTVGTVGMLKVPNGSINVVPGRCQFSLDLRATTNAPATRWRATCSPSCEAICDAPRPALQGGGDHARRRRAERARLAAPLGARRRIARACRCYRLPSGAGHDAMKLHEVMPQAMLFVRGLNAGISHNPLESTTSDDADLCVRAFQHLLEQLDRHELPMTAYQQLDAWIDAHFDEEVRIAAGPRAGAHRHAAGQQRAACRAHGRAAGGLRLRGREVPGAGRGEVKAAGLESITNLIVRRRYGQGKTIALNAHGDVVPPGEGWTHDPYGGEVVGRQAVRPRVGGQQVRLRHLHLRHPRARVAGRCR